MKELIKKLRDLDYTDEFIEHFEKNVYSQNEFDVPKIDYENVNQTTNDSSELFLMEVQEAQSNFYIVNSSH